MPIYKMVNGKERLEKVGRTSFGDQGVFERGDLQRILRDPPDVLEEGLLIISEEFGDWQDSNRRIDLLALNATGRLTVVELKRGNTATTAGAGFALRLLLAQMPPVPRSSTNRWWRYGKYPFYPQKHLPQSLPETSLLSERWNTERRAALHHGGLPTAPPCRCRNRIAERPATGRRSRRTSHS